MSDNLTYRILTRPSKSGRRVEWKVEVSYLGMVVPAKIGGTAETQQKAIAAAEAFIASHKREKARDNAWQEVVK